MRQTIAILAPSSVPFVIGGAEKFWGGLHRALQEHGNCAADLIKLPCPESSFKDIINSYRMFMDLDLTHFDMVISTKYPAWAVRHPNHVVYMQHTLRGLYDTYHFTGFPTLLPAQLSDIPEPLRELMQALRQPQQQKTSADAPLHVVSDDHVRLVFDLLQRALATRSLPESLFAFPGPLIREVVHFLDAAALQPQHVRAYAAIAHNVRCRADYFPPHVDVKIIHHPTDLPEYVPLLHAPAAPQGHYIFTASRLVGIKRVDLLIKAMRHVQAHIPLRIAGTGPELENLKALAAEDKRIEFLGHVSDAALARCYAGALFVPFVPHDEDYGLITIEAMRAGKPVITVEDAGGVCEMVQHEVTGLIVPPNAPALGAAMQSLAANPPMAQRMGEQARQSVAHISWKRTVESLLAHAEGDLRPKILVCSTFRATPPIAGGQRRLYHLCRELGQHFRVVLLCTHKDACEIQQEQRENFKEIILPWSQDCHQAEEALRTRAGSRVEDLACMQSCGQDATWLHALEEYGSDASLVLLGHPYLYPAVAAALPNTPLCYDAHNVEYDMKTTVLEHVGTTAQCADILAEVHAVEAACCRAAQRVFTCSTADAQSFARLYDVEAAKTLCVPNGYDASQIAFTTPQERQALKASLGAQGQNLALFVGSAHAPNASAVTMLKDVALHLPHVWFFIVGSVCQMEGMRHTAPPNMVFVGQLDEAEKNLLLASADVGLNPVVAGAGTNLKIVEYLAAGLEVVSTAHGLRGLDLPLPTVHIATPENFASAIDLALRMPQTEAALRQTAQAVTEHLSWSQCMAPLCAAVREALTMPDKEQK